MITWTRFVSAAALGLLSVVSCVSAADATQWTIIPQASSVRFSETQMGQPLMGRFERFSGRIDFEPGAMPKGDVHIDVDITSIKTGADDRDAMALGDDWFIAKRMPRAIFAAQAFKQIGPDNYEANGQITIKGVTIPVALPFNLRVGSNGQAEMNGQVSLDRLKLGLGTGQFNDAAVVATTLRFRCWCMPNVFHDVPCLRFSPINAPPNSLDRFCAISGIAIPEQQR